MKKGRKGYYFGPSIPETANADEIIEYLKDIRERKISIYN